MSLTPTPGQTVGPFFHYALPYAGDAELVPPARAEAIRLHGRVYDGAGDPVPDALVEVWQTGPDGAVPQVAGSLRRDGYTFTGFGRAQTDRTGHYRFSTLRPGALSSAGAPYFALTVFARGLLDRLFTRAYLPGAAPAELAALEAVPDDRGFVFDIRLQGEDETVFLSHARD
ncbi:protocatechuate 3,4-dioxygenase subunit alpha [Nocardioides soli]|uniref:Protocatechuate 3,4-dioxygenase alpha subunit n=1 Tax=Nocardioides soli TaxID=1036020 RepID=A0A7W4VVA6_9ACTN|nr:protocatechuate 3,4-dioxygenase alpha subunit [Nocardioides soli]